MKSRGQPHRGRKSRVLSIGESTRPGIGGLVVQLDCVRLGLIRLYGGTDLQDCQRIADLVSAAQRGDDRSFGELVRAYQDIAVAYATVLLRDYHLAEDAAQEAFVEAHRALPALRAPAAFASWLRTIIRKHCDRMTRRKRHPTAGLDAALAMAARTPSPHETLESRETNASLQEAIATLTHAEREAVLLYYMGERSHREIAAFLQVTTNAIKTRLYSARLRLREHMEHIEKRLDAARPSGDKAFAEKVSRMIRPLALTQNAPLQWSSGIGVNVWEMFCACILGDLDKVKRLLEEDSSLVRSHYEYRTPLSFAVRENQVEVAAFLLERGADPLALGDPLAVARERGYVEMVKLLESWHARMGVSSNGEAIAAAIRDQKPHVVRGLLNQAPELLQAGDARSNQPIHWAVMTLQLDLIDELLARGADINARRQDGARPIHLTNGDYFYRGWRDVPADTVASPDDVYRHLVSRGAQVDIGMAAAKGDVNRVRALLDEDPSLVNRVSEYNSYYIGCGAPLKNAAAGGHIEIVHLLLARGADPNLPEEGIAPHGHALYSAVYHGHFEIAKLLLEHGAYPNPPVESSADAVWIAIRNGDKRMIELLAANGATWEIPIRLDGTLTYQDIAATGIGRSVSVLAEYSDIDTAAALFATGASLAHDAGALGNAAGHGHEDFVRLMLRYHPDLAKDVTVSRPRAMALFLFEHGMDPNRPNWLRATPLHHFAEHGDVESAALFLDHGADLHARDEEFCSTPLAWAARCGRTNMVEFLLRRGARPTLTDDPHWATPRAWASRRGHDDIVRLLQECEESGAPPARGPDYYQAQVCDLVEAYGTGGDAAMQRVAALFDIERPLTWDRPAPAERVTRLRRYVWERLGIHAEADPGPLTLADARLLIARLHGFQNWPELTKPRED